MTYTYDGDGNRVKKSSGRLYWRSGPLAESDLSGSSTSWREYVFFNGKRVARRDASNSTVHYYFEDHLGSTSAISNAAGTLPLEQDVDYFPYGAAAYGTTADHYLFTGKERDSESGLDSFGKRYYASTMGRWMSPDLVNLTEDRVVNPANTLNKYGYGGNAPLKYIDPDGQDITVFYDQGGAAGHIVLLAYDQTSGKSAVQSFGEANHGIGTKVAMLVGLPVAGQDNYSLQNVTVDQLRQQYASITIQTNPEEAQAAIQYIKTHPDGDYTLYWDNCTTTCSRILRQLKLTKSHALTPGIFFEDLLHQYGNNSWISTGFNIRNGVDYGHPRWGYDPFDVLSKAEQQKPPHEQVTHRICYTDENGKKVCE